MKKTSPTNQTKKRHLQGTVIRRSGRHTVSVEVLEALRHPMYKKSLKHSKRYLVHDPDDSTQVGDMVTIQESRPLSRRKRWIIIKK